MTDRELQEVIRRGARALAVTRRQAQERRAAEWRAYVKGGPVPKLTDAEVERLYKDILRGGMDDEA